MQLNKVPVKRAQIKKCKKTNIIILSGLLQKFNPFKVWARKAKTTYGPHF